MDIKDFLQTNYKTHISDIFKQFDIGFYKTSLGVSLLRQRRIEKTLFNQDISTLKEKVLDVAKYFSNSNNINLSKNKITEMFSEEIVSLNFNNIESKLKLLSDEIQQNNFRNTKKLEFQFISLLISCFSIKLSINTIEKIESDNVIIKDFKLKVLCKLLDVDYDIHLEKSKSQTYKNNISLILYPYIGKYYCFRYKTYNPSNKNYYNKNSNENKRIGYLEIFIKNNKYYALFKTSAYSYIGEVILLNNMVHFFFFEIGVRFQEFYYLKINNSISEKNVYFGSNMFFTETGEMYASKIALLKTNDIGTKERDIMINDSKIPETILAKYSKEIKEINSFLKAKDPTNHHSIFKL